MNKLVLVVTSDLKRQREFVRLAESIDLSEQIFVYFVNQSRQKSLADVYDFKKCNVEEIRTYKNIPLSIARNIALEKLYSETDYGKNSFIMFIDDDAWFPKDTIKFLLNCSVRGLSLCTKDPQTNKSFSKANRNEGEIRGWHLVRDIVSICLVVPLNELCKYKLKFNEKLGLGNEISQGEESLFIYKLSKYGMKFEYNSYFIYHPYKKTFNMKNYYSMAYFWSWGFFHVSKIFFVPMIRNLVKYTIGFVFAIKDKRYVEIGKKVWKGTRDGYYDTAKISC